MGAIYANTLARINMGRLLNAEKYKRLIDADYDAALKMLADYGYGGGVAGDDVDSVIEKETNALIAFIEDECVNAHARAALLNRFYYNNAKALYKARYRKIDLTHALYNVALDLTGITAGDYDDVSPFMRAALEELDTVEAPPHPRTVDTVLTKAMYADCLFHAGKSHSRTLKKFFVAEIDLNNILSVLRAKTLGLSAEETEGQLVEGGDVGFETLAALHAAEVEQIADVLAGTPYETPIARLTEKGGHVAAFETSTDDYLYMLTESGAVKLDRFDVFLRYVLAQLTEFKTVKMILVCIKNGVKEEIAARLRYIDD